MSKSSPILLDDDSPAPEASQAREVKPGSPYFSDGEEEEAPPADAATDQHGYNFSGTVSAYAGHPACAGCGEALRPTWHAEREELVIEDAFLLRFRVYHTHCVRTQRPVT